MECLCVYPVCTPLGTGMLICMDFMVLKIEDFHQQCFVHHLAERTPPSSAHRTQELRAWAGRSTASIIQLATKSSHLKGTYVKKFKEAASELQAIVEALTTRNEAEETRRLQADNNRLRSELEIIRAEQKAYRRDFTEMKTAMAKEAAREASKMAAEGASAKKAATGAPPASALQADVLEE
ncbi:jg26630, partial [Pararge aegeria aegeria]